MEVAMSLDHSLIGVPSEPSERSWTSADALLYAVGCGAGLGDPLQELEFTTENSEGVTQQVLPTYGVLLAQTRRGRRLGDFDPALLVHAEQAFELHRPIPVDGTVRTVATVTGMYDKGSGALVVTEATATDTATGEPLVTSRSSAFIRGEGGFGGDRGPSDPWARPDRDPDLTVIMPTRPEQALVYRLSGDRNPLHADPKFAGRGGFSKPILHGLCTYGVVCKSVVDELLDGDVTRVAAYEVRFAGVVFPGETLRTSGWREGDRLVLATTVDERGGAPALSGAELRIR
jgi:acyl dehydratase